MTCSGAMSARCRHDEARAYRVINDVIRLCDICADVARSLGMDPRPLPAWVARAEERRLPGKVYA